jgi:hypothetical protein
MDKLLYRIVSLLMLLALPVMGQPSYWFSQWQKSGNAQIAQEYFMHAGPGISITWTNPGPYVWINATGGGGGSTNTAYSTNATYALWATNWTGSNALYLLAQSFTNGLSPQTNIYATNLMGLSPGTNVTFSTNGHVLSINATGGGGGSFPLASNANANNYSITNLAGLYGTNDFSPSSPLWSITDVPGNGTAFTFNNPQQAVNNGGGGATSGLQLNWIDTGLGSATSTRLDWDWQGVVQFYVLDDTYNHKTTLDFLYSGNHSTINFLPNSIVSVGPHLVIGTDAFGNGIGITNAQFSSHIFTNSVLLDGVITNLNFLPGTNTVVTATNNNGSMDLAVNVTGAIAKSGGTMSGMLTNTVGIFVGSDLDTYSYIVPGAIKISDTNNPYLAFYEGASGGTIFYSGTSGFTFKMPGGPANISTNGVFTGNGGGLTNITSTVSSYVSQSPLTNTIPIANVTSPGQILTNGQSTVTTFSNRVSIVTNRSALLIGTNSSSGNQTNTVRIDAANLDRALEVSTNGTVWVAGQFNALNRVNTPFLSVNSSTGISLEANVNLSAHSVGIFKVVDIASSANNITMTISNIVASGSISATNGFRFDTNAAPTGVTIGVTAPDFWIKAYSQDGKYMGFSPVWTNH